jgi:hypothetical protein
MKRSWYVYIGGEVTDVLSYIKLEGIVPLCMCGNEICVINAEGSSTHPVSPLSKNIRSYIFTGLASGQLQPERPYGCKKYLYLR